MEIGTRGVDADVKTAGENCDVTRWRFRSFAIDDCTAHLIARLPTLWRVRVVKEKTSSELAEWNFEVQLLNQAIRAAAIFQKAAEDEAHLASKQLARVVGALADDFEDKGGLWRERQVEALLKLQIYRRNSELLRETLEHSKAALARIERRL
jgi:hypothetical protein